MPARRKRNDSGVLVPIVHNRAGNIEPRCMSLQVLSCSLERIALGILDHWLTIPIRNFSSEMHIDLLFAQNKAVEMRTLLIH